jgi:hypothetical protein
MLGVGVIDICLWDIAGKLYDEPLYRLLGGEKNHFQRTPPLSMAMKTADCRHHRISLTLQNSATGWVTDHLKFMDGDSLVPVFNEK